MSDVVEGERVRFDCPTLRKEREGWGTRHWWRGMGMGLKRVHSVGKGKGVERKLCWASPIVFCPRISDFLSKVVTLSNFMPLSLRESRIRGGV